MNKHYKVEQHTLGTILSYGVYSSLKAAQDKIIELGGVGYVVRIVRL